MRICSLEDCERRYYARGYCRAHYTRWWKGRDIEGPIRPGNAGAMNGAWKGGRWIDSQGYARVHVALDSPFFCMARQTGGSFYVPEHRLVMARHLRRPLRRDEQVHHINGDRADNRLENLQLRQGKHGAGAAFACGDCGSTNVVALPLQDPPGLSAA